MAGNKKRKPLNRFANILISLGISLIVAVAVYEAVNYPWRSADTAEALSAPEFPVTNDPEINYIAYDPNNPGVVSQESDSSALSAAPIFAEEKLPGTYTVLGAIKIPKINIAENVLEGTGPTQFGAGVGHIAGTALPGQTGNCVLAGHRLLLTMHPFRHLDKINAGDKIYLTFNGNDYIYEVYDSFVVDAKSDWVMDIIQTEEYALTLITCETVYNPVDRLILRARLIST
jgi:sortase A